MTLHRRTFRIATVGLGLAGVVSLVAGPALASAGVSPVTAANSTVMSLRPQHGTVDAFGSNEYGELGIGSTVFDSPVRVQVHGLTGVISVAGGRFSGYALRANGTVYAWGSNFVGQLGNGTTITESLVPVQVRGLTHITAIAAGAVDGYALRSDGTVYAWGLNVYGELGNGTTTVSRVPVRVRGLAHITAIAGGADDGYALRSGGTVYAWGNDEQGELGNGTTAPASHVPVQVRGLAHVTAIAGGADAGYALRSGGTMYAWGGNAKGQLGNGAITNSRVPVRVRGLTGVIAIAGGMYAGYALHADRTVSAWGYNNLGELGNGTTIDSHVPVHVRKLTGVIAIAGGGLSGFALRANGTVYAWGDNGSGELGNGSTTDSHVPVQVRSLTGVSAIAGAEDTGYAIVR